MRFKPYRQHLLVCFGKRCAARGAEAVLDRFKRRLKEGDTSEKSGVRLSRTGCLKLCKATGKEGEHSPVVLLYPDGVWYARVSVEDVDEIVESHIKNGRLVERLCCFKIETG